MIKTTLSEKHVASSTIDSHQKCELISNDDMIPDIFLIQKDGCGFTDL